MKDVVYDVYVASKALAAWYLMIEATDASKRISDIGCAEPLGELYFAELSQQLPKRK